MINISSSGMNQTTSIVRQQRLRSFCNAALKYQERKDIHRTALCIYVIHSEKLFKESEYQNIYDLGKSLLGASKVTTSNYINVAKKFLDGKTGRSIFESNNKDFGFSQLVELKRLDVDDVRKLLECGEITLDTTAKDIKNVVSEYIARTKEEARKAKEDSLKPLKEAYENFNTAFNELYESVTDEHFKELLSIMMDSAVTLYNENDRLWN